MILDVSRPGGERAVLLLGPLSWVGFGLGQERK